jgi:hypothetical protein
MIIGVVFSFAETTVPLDLVQAKETLDFFIWEW